MLTIDAGLQAFGTERLQGEAAPPWSMDIQRRRAGAGSVPSYDPNAFAADLNAALEGS